MAEFFNQYIKLIHTWLVIAFLIGVPFVIGYCVGSKNKPLEKDNNADR